MSLLQTNASNPELSVWVSASAGTGKTQILIERVLRLLISGEPLNKILCITFTNAAANEMKERVIHTLSSWAAMIEHECAQALTKLLGRACTHDEVMRAKKLYNLYTTTNDNIKIQTIHSFCQRLLKNFPLEASVTPNFQIIDEIKVDLILKQVTRKLLNQEDLVAINHYLAANFHELTINQLFADIISHKAKFLRQGLATTNDIAQQSKTILSELQIFDHEYSVLQNHPIIQDIIGINPTHVQIKQFFLTDKGKKRQRIVNKSIAVPGSNMHNDILTLQDAVFTIEQKSKHSKLKCHSKLIHLLASRIIGEYESFKSKHALLDYEDLITKCCLLLNSSDARAWVLYKLDGFINHLLIDEAQDTSIDQWNIIKALITEFYSGSSGHSNPSRTIFIVGDDKQSIFSFQGAHIESFTKMNQFLHQRMSFGDKIFQNIDLQISYRSAKEILEIVFLVFSQIKKQSPHLFSANIHPLHAYRSHAPGRVELWPLCTANVVDDQIFWPVITTSDGAITQTAAAQDILAQKIALYIKHQLDSGEIIASTGKKIESGDFMILVRKRDALTKKIIKSLQKHEIPISGLDRIVLNENLSVRDLIAAANFMLNPYNDLNLISLLKSPLFACSDDMIMQLLSVNNATTHNDQVLNQSQSHRVSRPPVWDIIRSAGADFHDHVALLQQICHVYNSSQCTNIFQYIADIMNFRVKLNAVNGPDSNESIDELIYTYQNFIQQEGNYLQKFLFWLEGVDTSIKKEVIFTDKVKIMTIHAAKGLQSPIVILCDTTSSININNESILWDDQGKCVSVRKSEDATSYYLALKELENNKAHAEYLRLLYVGMTRAADKLIIFGYEWHQSIPSNCWYQLIQDTLLPISVVGPSGELIYCHNNLYTGKTACIQPVAHIEEFYVDNNLLDFIDNSLLTDNLLTVSASQENSTSKNERNNQKAITLGQEKATIYHNNPTRYGIIFHKILEEAITNNSLSLTLMKQHPLIATLDHISKQHIIASIDRIMHNQAFLDLINCNQRIETEVIIGTPDGSKVSINKIDLVVYFTNRIIIVEYKSNHKPPQHQDMIFISYKQQLMHYRHIIQHLEPDKEIVTYILWLETGQLMHIE